MATDLEIIQQLGRETKLEITKGDLHTGMAKGYETDEEENVIGLSLNSANLIEFPRLILKLKRLRDLELGMSKKQLVIFYRGPSQVLAHLNQAKFGNFLRSCN